jgi:hypothetical protein
MTWPELLRQLSEPFPLAAIQWRAGSTTRDKKRAQALCRGSGIRGSLECGLRRLWTTFSACWQLLLLGPSFEVLAEVIDITEQF